jgi:hypothetical protein
MNGPLSKLNFAPLEEVILLNLGAVRTLKAADEEHGHADRDQHGEHARIRHEPLS